MTRFLVALGLMAAIGLPFVMGEPSNDHTRERARIAVVTYETWRASDFVRARNAEIEDSLAAYKAQRTATEIAERNAEIEASLAAYEAQRSTEFVAARNAEIETALAAYETRRFTAARNAEIEASIAATETRRLNGSLSAAIDGSLPRPTTEIFVEARNAEIEASLVAYQLQRSNAEAEARNREIEACLAAYETERFIAARNAEIEKSVAAYETRRFTDARNAEIAASLTATEKERLATFVKERNAEIAMSIAIREARLVPLETGTIGTGLNTNCATIGDGIGAIQFAPASARLDASSKAVLNHLAALAETCRGVVIGIHGHSDAAGSTQANLRLSQRRAQSVAAYLIEQGVDAHRLLATGHGASAPIAPNTTPEGRAHNRRIEFTIENTAADQAAAATHAVR